MTSAWRLLVACVLVGCCFHGAGAPRPGTRMERMALEVQAEFPDIAAHFAGMSYDSSFAEGAALTTRGMPRMSDDDSLAFAVARAHLLSLDDARCAAMISGDSDAAMAGLESLTDDEMRTFLRLTTRAQSLELRGGPRPMTHDEATARVRVGIEAMHSLLPSTDMARFDEVLGSAVPADGCFVERTLLRGVLAMPRAEGASFFRAALEAAQP